MDALATGRRARAASEPAYDDYDDRDHRKSGWSLFGKKRTRPQPTYPQPAGNPRRRCARPPRPSRPSEPTLGQAEDDLEIPSFLRRLAN
jgi:cell division protein FtsZ